MTFAAHVAFKNINISYGEVRNDLRISFGLRGSTQPNIWYIPVERIFCIIIGDWYKQKCTAFSPWTFTPVCQRT